MENERCEKQAPLQFRCKKIVPGEAKPNNSPAVLQIMEADGKQDSGASLASPTPEKPESKNKAKGLASSRKVKNLSQDFLREGTIIQSDAVNSEISSSKDSLVSEISKLSAPVPIRSLKDELIKLPEKYKTLADLFDRMESSIRLLGLHGRLPTFQNICTQVQILTKRKFLCSHLAQMKYAFPEAIQIEKILIHDGKSLCMKPDMKITLLPDVVGCYRLPDQSAAMALCHAFHSRLLEFCITHPEGTEIPEAMLPEPFSQRNHTVISTSPEESAKELCQPTFADFELLSNASHFSSSFSKQFSERPILPEVQRTQLSDSPASMVSVSIEDKAKEVSKSPQRKENLHLASDIKSSSGVMCTPSRMVSEIPESTPAKDSLHSDELMMETPALQTPKRPLPTPHEKLDSGEEILVPEPRSAQSVRRSLIYSPSKPDKSLSDPDDCTSDQNVIAQYSTKQTTATQLQMRCDGAVSVVDDHNMSPTRWGKSKELLSCLLGVFDTIHLISRSCDCSLITKQELVHKIISNNMEIEETREVEEQLGLLEDLIPDWISKETASSGDLLYCIKRASDPETIRSRLVEAV